MDPPQLPREATTPAGCDCGGNLQWHTLDCALFAMDRAAAQRAIDDALARAVAHTEMLNAAVRHIVREGVGRDEEPRRYAAARASLVESLRRVCEDDLSSPAERLLQATSGMLAESLECWSPFASMASRPAGAVPSGGCYRASFGWVHTKPSCRCGKTREGK